jgi:hypothetical protein
MVTGLGEHYSVAHTPKSSPSVFLCHFYWNVSSSSRAISYSSLYLSHLSLGQAHSGSTIISKK